MGCCTSSTAKHAHRPPPPHTNIAAKISLAPPDEETVVKEVLSETPISKPPQIFTHTTTTNNHHVEANNNGDAITTSDFICSNPRPINARGNITDNFSVFMSSHQELNPRPLSAGVHNNDNVLSTSDLVSSHQELNPRPLSAGINRRKAESKEEKTPEVSQVSEICSVTDTISTATTTTTVTEIRDDEVTSVKRVVNRSPGKLPRKRPYTGDRVDRTVPARRERSSVTRVRRDIGERSGRRSRSPATRVAGGAGKGRGAGSPGKMNGGVGNRLVEKEGEKKEERNDGVLGEEQGNNESLENPLVSLECFIFL